MSEEKLIFKIKTAAKIKNFLRITTENDSIISCFEAKDVELLSKLEPEVRIRLTVWKNGIYTNGNDIEILGSAAGAAHSNNELTSADKLLSEKNTDLLKIDNEFKRIRKFMLGLSALIQDCFKD